MKAAKIILNPNDRTLDSDAAVKKMVQRFKDRQQQRVSLMVDFALHFEQSDHKYLDLTK